MKKLITTLLISVTVCLCLHAQPGDPGGDPDNPVPITGLEILIAAGAALGIRSFVKAKK
ncbi:hypothetical protein [Fulvivirga aurantia]|uniref:hypothetical protein n=1 Tax=Fulvivirga aurantia TaxID=2529383 RepID=UPI0012BBFE74|nr:hypothetical protein [Fulvivirga aurantia]